MINGITHGQVELAPSDTRVELLYIHHNYGAIPPGPVELTVRWDVYEKNAKNEHLLIASPMKAIRLNIPPATAENLTHLSDQFAERVKNARNKEDALRHIRNSLLFTKHAELLPLCLLGVQSSTSDFDAKQFINRIYDLSPSVENGHQYCIDFISESGPEQALQVFANWANWRHVDLTDAQIGRLIRHPNHMVRSLAYAAFPDRCDVLWVASLEAEWVVQTSPLTESDYANFATSLNSNSFRKREAATKSLIQLGDRVKVHLRNTLIDPHTPEVRQRIGTILASIESNPSLTLDLKFLDFLVRSKSPSARHLLKTIAIGSPDFRIVLGARERLQKFANTPTP